LEKRSSEINVESELPFTLHMYHQIQTSLGDPEIRGDLFYQLLYKLLLDIFLITFINHALTAFVNCHDSNGTKWN
jgi:hypothetical protein